MLEQAPGRTCSPMERGVHAGAGLLAGLVTLWGPTLELSVPEGLHPMGRDPTPEQFLKNCSPLEELTLEKFVEDCLPQKGPGTEAGEVHKESSP